jgi:hypothetical protein
MSDAIVDGMVGRKEIDSVWRTPMGMVRMQ